MSVAIAEKRKIIRRLEKSNFFSEKELFLKILHYLVDAEEEKKVVKSTTIAIDLLTEGTEGSRSIQDSMIRRKIRELRKELEVYYLTEGKKEPYKLSVAKSNYKVNIIEQKKVKRIGALFTFNGLKVISLISFVIILCLVGFVCYLLQERKELTQTATASQESSLISMFIDKKENLDIVVGDRAFYSEYDQELGRYRYIYDYDVSLPHTNYKMNKLMTNYPERRITSFFNFFHADIENLLLGADLKLEWGLAGSKSRILQASKLPTEALENNTIFISKTRSGDLHDLSAYLLDSRFTFDGNGLTGGCIIAFKINKDTIIPLRAKKSPHNLSSYYFIKKIKTKNNKSLLFLLATEDKDRHYIHSKFNDATFKKEIIESFKGDIPDNFILVLKVFGNRKIANSHKIVYNSAATIANEE